MIKANVTAYAKINLVLDVLRKRADGYHEVSMVMQAVDLADTIQLEEAPRNWLVTDSKYIPPNMNNLAMRAVTLMQSRFKQVSPLQVTCRNGFLWRRPGWRQHWLCRCNAGHQSDV